MTTHPPVLLQEVLRELAIQPGMVVVDATLGGGGYTAAFARALQGEGILVGLDVEQAALDRTKERLRGINLGKVLLLLRRTSFADLEEVLANDGIERVDRIAFDLGLSHFHLQESKRGFSFLHDEPLLMTLAESEFHQGPTAAEIVNQWPEASLAELLRKYGDEPYARRIAKAIVRERSRKPIFTSGALARVIEQVVPRRGKRHPATRAFQAIRIAVNNELQALEEGLQSALRVLAPGGRIAVVSFHSGEDRVVKAVFREAAQHGIGVRRSKKPVVPRPEEIAANPAARSAKLRVFEKK
ncbi:MAG: ribosomal RNA small subunit methyltransferase H [Candidatus Parcubacteria bacterium]|nr:MAG: ribosomal RNA small subunit methyltransferase H [Candidatus Parcubacteria bacterium]